MFYCSFGGTIQNGRVSEASYILSSQPYTNSCSFSLPWDPSLALVPRHHFNLTAHPYFNLAHAIVNGQAVDVLDYAYILSSV